MTFPIYGKRESEIQSLEDWFRFAPPANPATQWQPGRSAMEFARAWLDNGCPRVPLDLERLLLGCEETQGLTFQKAFAEAKTQFKDSARGPRSHDLLVEAQTHTGQLVVLGIEGKEREEFDGTLDQSIKDAKRKSECTQLPKRVDNFCRALFGRPYDTDLKDLRYQFFSGICGTLVEGQRRGATLSVFVVIQFKTTATPKVDLERNANDYVRFVRTLFKDDCMAVKDGKMYGPLCVPGSELVPAGRVIVGKITSVIPSPPSI